MVPLRCAAKFDPFLSLDCAPPRPPPWRNPRNGRDQILPSGNTDGEAAAAAAIEVRPRERTFEADAAPVARWSAFVIWRPSGALSVYVVKLDRRVVERKEFQGRNSMQLLNITKTVV